MLSYFFCFLATIVFSFSLYNLFVELTKKLESAESKSNEGEADGRLQELEVENNRIKEELGECLAFLKS